jgi:hypothetical protein
MPPRKSAAQIRSEIRRAQSQAQSQIRRAQSQARQEQQRRRRAAEEAQRKLRRAVNDYNSGVRKAVNEYNAGVRQVNREIDRYNAAVRTHNAKVRSNRQRLRRELDRLDRTPSRTTITVPYRTSVQQFTTSFETLEGRAKAGGWGDSDVMAWSSAEAVNSVVALNALLGSTEDDEQPDADDAQLRETRLGPELAQLDADLGARWEGALYSLHPDNPDAARHFCTSAREMLSRIISTVAPTEEVLAANPAAARTDANKLTRRARIEHCLARRNLDVEGLGEFVDDDIDNVLSLFDEFNDGTHGSAGQFTIRQLLALKTRVEDAVLYVFRLVGLA